MPFIHVEIAKGRTEEQLKALGPAITRAVQEALDAPADKIRIRIQEYEPGRFFVGGESLAELRATGKR